MPNGPPLVEQFFSTFFTEIVIDPETTVVAPFTNGLDFTQVVEIDPFPQNPLGVVVVLVRGTPAEVGQLNAFPGALIIGEGQARVFLGLNTKGNQGWGTADLPPHWKLGP